MSGDRSLDPYEVLGVGPAVSVEELKVAFRNKARLSHPDKEELLLRRGAGAASDGGADFRVVRQAYEILTDPERRRAHDAARRVAAAALAPPRAAFVRSLRLQELRRAQDEGWQGAGKGTDRYLAECRCGFEIEVADEELFAGVRVFECDGCSGALEVLLPGAGEGQPDDAELGQHLCGDAPSPRAGSSTSASSAGDDADPGPCCLDLPGDGSGKGAPKTSIWFFPFRFGGLLQYVPGSGHRGLRGGRLGTAVAMILLGASSTGLLLFWCWRGRFGGSILGRRGRGADTGIASSPGIFLSQRTD